MSRNVKWVHAPSHEAASHWLPAGYSLPTRPATSRAFFALGESLTLYEAARIISGRHPYPLSPDGVTTLGPHIGLISAGSTGLTRRRHRPQRGKAAFEALRQKVMSGEIIPAEMCRLAQPGTISDGGIDWLNVKVATADVVRLCEEQGWRVRFTCPSSVPSPAGRRRYTVFDKARVMEFLKSCDIDNCDEAVKRAEKSLGIDIGQVRGRKEAGRYRPAGRPRGTRRPRRLPPVNS